MTKLSMLKLLWLNLKHMKANGQSPNSTFDFLGADEMVNYLTTANPQMIEMLFVTMNVTGASDVSELPQEMLALMPDFVNVYDNFMSEEAPVKKSAKKSAKAVKKVKTPEPEPEEVEEEADDVNDDAGDEELDSDDEVEEPVPKKNKKKNLKEVDIDSDEELDSDEDDDEDEDLLDTFFDATLEEEDGSSLKLSEIVSKYKTWCKKNHQPEEDLEEYLTNRLGAPKGKKAPKYSGVKFL